MVTKPPGKHRKKREARSTDPEGSTVRPDALLRRRIERVIRSLSEISGRVTFNQFACAALRAHCETLEGTLKLPPLTTDNRQDEKGTESV